MVWALWEEGVLRGFWPCRERDAAAHGYLLMVWRRSSIFAYRGEGIGTNFLGSRIPTVLRRADYAVRICRGSIRTTNPQHSDFTAAESLAHANVEYVASYKIAMVGRRKGFRSGRKTAESASRRLAEGNFEARGLTASAK